MACCSLEIFAPRSAAGVEELLRGRLPEFAKRGPRFVGVSGAASSGTLRLAAELRNSFAIAAQLHLPRAGASEAELGAAIDAAMRVGVRDVLLLGGAPGTLHSAGGGDFASAAAAVKFVKAKYGELLRVAVCGFPRGTSGEAGDYLADLKELQKQVEAGAETVICLPVFETRAFTDFVADVAKMSLRCVVLPGLLPIREPAEFQRICRSLHLTPPAWLLARLADAAAAPSCGDALFVSLVRELKAAGHSWPHVYTLNAASTLSLLDAAGYTPLAHRAATR
ncbi:hypothetical protein AB1Y20_004207 [Prymnesium parvum]|uniref:Methylenetetrahydrofolate reductase (NAD(P)H) n=1 Tax=Prymnesium parvum TaxID=97485 RepID=A0AB34J9B5_PRYPA